jgi:SAM-dependent methyltransferase
MRRLGHDTADTDTGGSHMGYGPAHDVLAAVFFGGRRRRVYTELATRSGARQGDRVLDVGCGDGYFTRVMANAVGAGGTALGVDPSPEAIARARKVTRAANCTFSEGVAEHLDASEGTYDVVVSSLMVHHLPEAIRPQALREMFRVLRPRGPGAHRRVPATPQPDRPVPDRPRNQPRHATQPAPPARTDDRRRRVSTNQQRGPQPLDPLWTRREAHHQSMTDEDPAAPGPQTGRLVDGFWDAAGLTKTSGQSLWNRQVLPPAPWPSRSLSARDHRKLAERAAPDRRVQACVRIRQEVTGLEIGHPPSPTCRHQPQPNAHNNKSIVGPGCAISGDMRGSGPSGPSNRLSVQTLS